VGVTFRPWRKIAPLPCGQFEDVPSLIGENDALLSVAMGISKKNGDLKKTDKKEVMAHFRLHCAVDFLLVAIA
jgi:hypothetical protein